MAGIIAKYLLILAVTFVAAVNAFGDERKLNAACEADLHILDFYKRMYGLGSEQFNLKLFQTFNDYRDISHSDAYPSFARLFLESRDSVINAYGANSESFRINTIALHDIFLKHHVEPCLKQPLYDSIATELTGLEKYLNDATANRHEFLGILSGAYSILGNFKKAISFAHKRVDESKNESNKLADSYASLLYALGAAGNEKDFVKTVRKAMSLRELKEEAYSRIICMMMVDMPSRASEKIWHTSLAEYIRLGLPFRSILAPLIDLACSKNYAIFEKLDSELIPGIPLEEQCNFYRTLGSILKERTENVELDIYYKRKAIELAEKASRPDLLYFEIDSIIRNDWLTLACLYQNTNDFINEMDAFSHAVEALSKYPGKNTASYIEARELATISCKNRLNSYQSDPIGLQRSIVELEESFAKGLCPDSIIKGITYKCIGDYFCSIKDYIEASDYYTQSLNHLKSLDYTDDLILSLLNNMADNEAMMSQFEHAIRIQKIVCETREAELGVAHWKTLVAKQNLISYLLQNKEFTRADSVFQTIRRNEELITIPEDKYNYYLTQAVLSNALSDWHGAAVAIDRAQELAITKEQHRRLNQERAQTCKGTGDRDAYYRWVLSEIDNAKDELIADNLTMSSEERRNAQFYIQNLRDWFIEEAVADPRMNEAVGRFCLFTKGLLFHTDAAINGYLDKNKKSRDERKKVNELLIQLDDAYLHGDSLSVASVKRRLRIAEKELASEYIAQTKLGALLKNVSKINSSLKAGDLAVDFVTFHSNDAIKYGAFIYESGNTTPVFIQTDASNVWKAIKPYIKNKRSIYFSTDGILNTIPIEFAEDEDGVPMCEKYDMHRVFHLSDIRKSEGIGNRVEAIGVADHNSPNGQARGLDDGYRGNWNDLAGVETELYRIAESLDGVSEYHRAFNDEATEAYVKSLSGQPITTLHISTHGFYRGEDELTKAFNDTTDFDHNIAKRLLMGNRTSASGLVMRNGNLSWKAETITEDEDNILTSEEVETLSFPKLSLTVLSACETGLGELSADGVWGLQRAFRMAGSASLICSLRQVKDNGAADFMAEFYRQAATGLSVHNAFYNARKELLSHDPANKDVWSSFILIE